MDSKDQINDGIFNPYNPQNKEITLNDVQCILKAYGLPENVNNLNLYKRAFIHTSYVKKPNYENEMNDVILAPKPINCIDLKTKSNERLEFLGDGILEAITKYYLYRRFPKENEGFMTEKKIALVKNEAIGKLAYQMRLHKWMIISKHAEEKNIRINIKKLGCLFEAFLGALFLDFNKIEIHDEDNYFKNLFVTGPGFQMAQIFIENIFEKHVNWIELLKTDDNYKNILQVVIQKRFKITPHYLEFKNNNNIEENIYFMGVYICFHTEIYNIDKEHAISLSKFNSIDDIETYVNENINKPILILLGKGENKTKKKAEQIACKECLDYLKL